MPKLRQTCAAGRASQSLYGLFSQGGGALADSEFSPGGATLHIVIPEPLSRGVPNQLGSYELLEVIAHDGMGVVCKARHTGLDRVVALKMIRSGVLASHRDVERFQRDARSAAKLHHPNIVTRSQNDDHKTTVNVYSLRAKEGPTVSTPVEWGEIEEALKRKNKNFLTFEAADAIERVAQKGDLFAPVLSLKQKLPSISALR